MPYTRAFHAYAGAYGVDTVVVALYGNLGAFARDAGHGADADEAVVYLGNLKLEEAAQELLVGARYRDFGVVVLVVYVGDDSAYGFAFAEEVAGIDSFLGRRSSFLSSSSRRVSRDQV